MTFRRILAENTRGLFRPLLIIMLNTSFYNLIFFAALLLGQRLRNFDETKDFVSIQDPETTDGVKSATSAEQRAVCRRSSRSNHSAFS